MEKKKETTVVYRGYIGIMKTKTETMWGPHTHTYSMPAYDHNAPIMRTCR